MTITSRTNETVKAIASLKDKKRRKETGLYIVEGRKMVREALLNGKVVKLIAGTEKAIASVGIEFERVLVVSDEVYSVMSDEVSPQGVLAVVCMDENDLCSPTSPCSIVLDGISDPGNLGTIMRTAVAVGIREIYLIDCCDPYSPKAVRASMSGIFFLKIHRLNDRSEALKLLEGIPLIVADMDGQDVFSFNPPEKFCLVIGSEADGVSDEIMSASHHRIKIPMSSKMESLNAGISCAVIMYELTAGKGNPLM